MLDRGVENNSPVEALTLLFSFTSRVTNYLNRWRIVFLIFVLVYVVLLSLDLGYMAIQWDENPHLYGGLLLSLGRVKDYFQMGSLYPPLVDVVTASFFKVFGVSVFSGRLVPLAFGVLSVWVVFEFAYQFYGPRNALLSSILLAAMPGFIWLCRIELIETALMFFFTLALMLFLSWMRTNNSKALLLSGVALGLGFLVKYQVLIGGLIILAALLSLWKGNIRQKLGKFSLIVLIGAAVAVPWMSLAYLAGSSATIGSWLYPLNVGNDERAVYSTRFPMPIFYLIEMTYPYPYVHPISLLIYIMALLGLVFWLFRRKKEDEFFLIWFLVVYIAFTLIPNKSWRYVTLVFPVLALSASSLLLFTWDKIKISVNKAKTNLSKAGVIAARVAAVALVLLVATSLVYSSLDAYSWVEQDHINVPVAEAIEYVTKKTAANETLVVLCPVSLFNADVARFYLHRSNQNQVGLWQYPAQAVDAYTPRFNETTLIESCETLNVKYLLLYEYYGCRYFKSDLWFHNVYEKLYNTHKFILDTKFGQPPHEIFIISFLLNVTNTQP